MMYTYVYSKPVLIQRFITHSFDQVRLKKYLHTYHAAQLMRRSSQLVLRYCQLCFFFYCFAGWGYIVPFTEVLTIYQIYHT
jgi:hypothetical protein